MTESRTSPDDESTAGGSAGDGPTDARGTWFVEWRTHRPFWGTALLGVGGAVLAGTAVVTPGRGPTVVGTPLELLAVGVVAVLAALALFVPARSTAVGVLGVVVATVGAGVVVATNLVASGVFLAVGVGVAAVGGTLCVAWRGDVDAGTRTTQDERGRTVTSAVALVTVLVLAGTVPGAATSAPFPAQNNMSGFVLYQGEFEADLYSYTSGYTANSAVSTDIPVARQQIKGLTADDFVIYKNFYREGTGYVNLELSATSIEATGSGTDTLDYLDFTDPRDEEVGVDLYTSEYYSKKAIAKLDVVPEFPLNIPVDNVAYWTCTPHNDSGFGTVNDVRLGIDSNPRLSHGEDLIARGHQLASTRSVLTGFELTVEHGRHESIEVPEDDCQGNVRNISTDDGGTTTTTTTGSTATTGTDP